MYGRIGAQSHVGVHGHKLLHYVPPAALQMHAPQYTRHQAGEDGWFRTSVRITPILPRGEFLSHWDNPHEQQTAVGSIFVMITWNTHILTRTHSSKGHSCNTWNLRHNGKDWCPGRVTGGESNPSQPCLVHKQQLHASLARAEMYHWRQIQPLQLSYVTKQVFFLWTPKLLKVFYLCLQNIPTGMPGSCPITGWGVTPPTVLPGRICGKSTSTAGQTPGFSSCKTTSDPSTFGTQPHSRTSQF